MALGDCRQGVDVKRQKVRYSYQAASTSRDEGSESLVIYTAITGRYDSLTHQPESATKDTDLVAFVENSNRVSNMQWHCRSLERGFDDPVRNAKIYKVLPHRYFSDTTYSLWLDGNVVINFGFPVERLVAEYLSDCDIALFRHSRRTCLYQEAQAAIHQGLDDPTRIRRQIERYTREGYPINAGLSENCVVLRRHSAAVEAFNEAWWEEIEQGTRRDQISFNYIAWKLGLRVQYFPDSISGGDGLFRKYPHRGQTLRSRARQVGRHVGKVWDRLLSPLVLPAASALSRRSYRRAMNHRLLRDHLCDEPQSEELAKSEPPAVGRDRSCQLGAVGDNKVVSMPRRTPGAGPVVAFGPERDFPTWNWVGYDTARELSKAYRVIVYSEGQRWAPRCDVLFIIKNRPPASFVAQARDHGTRIVYCPIDFYLSRKNIDGDSAFLKSCDMVLVHCERQIPLVRPYCPATHFVEHHSKYTLPQMADFKEDGYVLWIGGCQYLSFILNWLKLHPIRNEVKILTDLDKAWNRWGARRYSTLTFRPDDRVIAGCEIHKWSERKQLEMMRECKAAIDLKQLNIFNQYYKPPTKAQKYVTSGIPFAINPGSYSEEYFRARGFQVASPVEPERWLSRSYWEQTRKFGLELRASTSLEAVGKRYRDFIESIL